MVNMEIKNLKKCIVIDGVSYSEGDIVKCTSATYDVTYEAVVRFGVYEQDGSAGEYTGEKCIGFYLEALSDYGESLLIENEKVEIPEYYITTSLLTTYIDKIEKI